LVPFFLSCFLLFTAWSFFRHPHSCVRLPILSVPPSPICPMCVTFPVRPFPSAYSFLLTFLGFEIDTPVLIPRTFAPPQPTCSYVCYYPSDSEPLLFSVLGWCCYRTILPYFSFFLFSVLIFFWPRAPCLLLPIFFSLLTCLRVLELYFPLPYFCCACCSTPVSLLFLFLLIPCALPVISPSVICSPRSFCFCPYIFLCAFFFIFSCPIFFLFFFLPVLVCCLPRCSFSLFVVPFSFRFSHVVSCCPMSSCLFTISEPTYPPPRSFLFYFSSLRFFFLFPAFTSCLEVSPPFVGFWSCLLCVFL